MEEEETNYGAPFDYYVTDKLEKDIDFKHFWSEDTFFEQGSNLGFIPSNIQKDMN